MPFIQVKTSVSSIPQEQINNLLMMLSGKLAQHLSKPESYVMTAFEGGVSMTFGGTFEPVCYLEIKSIGQMNPRQTQAMSQDFCEAIAAEIGVPPSRIYIEYTDIEGYQWGWNSSTF